MTRILLLVPAAALILIAGCGPLQMPLPERLDPETQTKIDEGWSKAFAPVNRFDHQGLLDVMVGARAYQLGVDSLAMKSEKRFAGGRAVMEVQYERTKPEQDRFEVTIYDDRGKMLRSERFDRSEIEATYRTLHETIPENAPDTKTRRAEQEARWNRVGELFPNGEKK